MATTNDEQTQAQKDQQEVISAKSVTKKDVLARYNSGKNYYELADEFFGFKSDEAVAKIREIVESEIEQN